MKEEILRKSVVKSAGRALAVLEYIASLQRSVTVGEVERALHIPQSSASSLLHSLVNLGYLEYLPDRTFRPTVRLSLLGGWLHGGDRPSWEPLAYNLSKLRDETNAVVGVGRRLGANVQIMSLLFPESKGPEFFGEFGGMIALPSCPTGRALMSAMPEATASKIIRRFNAESDLSKVRETEMTRVLEHIRQSGVSESDIRIDGPRDYYTLSMLATTGDGSEPIVLGLAGSVDYMLSNRAYLIEALRKLAVSPV